MELDASSRWSAVCSRTSRVTTAVTTAAVPGEATRPDETQSLVAGVPPRGPLKGPPPPG